MARTFAAVVATTIAVILAAAGCGGGDEAEQICIPQEKECDGSDVVKCNADGSDWSFYKACPDGCKDGQCKSNGTCAPACGGKECGDDGCGGTCGLCGAGTTCQAGTCKAGACTPNCAGKTCGSDGCSGTCGTCYSSGGAADPSLCQANGTCCVQSCAGKQCGPDGCGGVCGTCPAKSTCTAQGQCQQSCVPSCSGKQCGSDGCGGDCGVCSDGICLNGKCGCEDSTDCSDESICYGSPGKCTMAFGRSYSFTLADATILEGDPNDGFSAWDVGGGMPDVFVECTAEGTLVFSSTVKNDTLSPMWWESFNMVVAKGQYFECTAYDNDVSDADWIGAFEFKQGIPASLLKDGYYGFDAGDPSYGFQTASFVITPN
ncbi:MAG: hypothetical protein FJ109_18990 [Deltaproteobacteria bacterium]|nr:hypothetical protein [Deltaproteobacteria bacterium]